jgi:hypothetical protein
MSVCRVTVSRSGAWSDPADAMITVAASAEETRMGFMSFTIRRKRSER